MRQILASIVLILLFSFQGMAQNAAAEFVGGLNLDTEVATSAFGVLAVKMNGDTLVAKSPKVKLLPASNTKLITTGLALNELGPSLRFETKIGIGGEVVDGVLEGDVYIIGGGDPTIASKDSIAVSQEALFNTWLNILKGYGITKVQGRIIGDGRYFEVADESYLWQYEDLGTYYGTGGNGLCYYRNTVDILATPGEKVGDDVIFTEIYPDVPWMDWKFYGKTGAAGSGDRIYQYTTDLAPVAEIRGTFAVDRAPRLEGMSNKYGAMTCAYYFHNYLINNGIEVTYGIADIDLGGEIRVDLSTGETAGLAMPPDSLKVIGFTLSPTIEEIAKIVNHRSDNFYAETLLKLLARVSTGSAVRDSCYAAEKRAIGKLGVNLEGVHIVDGSGLSRNNYISPDFLCRFLIAMSQSKYFDNYLNTICQPGHNSYGSRLKNYPKDVKDRIFIKSGSMGGVRCYSGYIFPKSGKAEDIIVFSIMSNNYTGHNSTMQLYIDNIIGLLAAEI